MNATAESRIRCGNTVYMSSYYRAFIVAMLISLSPAQLFSQQNKFQEELKFVNYLLDKSLYKEAMEVLAQQDTSVLSRAEKDAFFYTMGWAAYQSKQLDSAIFALLKVSPAAPEYAKSHSFAAYSMAHTRKYTVASRVFSEIPARDSIEQELLLLQQAGLALLQHDFRLYDSLRKGFNYSSYVVQKEEAAMDVFHKSMLGFKKKSPFLAGVYSAVIPGAGKWYAGKKKQGIAAFLPVVSLGAVAYEAYRKGGVKSARFIAFGSLFSLFYIGNIWGSVMSVNVRKHEFNREYENKILFNMHIPLRNFYN